MNTNNVKGYHAHIYYDADSYDQAQLFAEAAHQQFSLAVGHMHKQAVGPHPRWSCQLSFKRDLLNEFIPWATKHRKGLTLFIHTVTGNDLFDHTDGTLWMGKMEELDLSIFNG